MESNFSDRVKDVISYSREEALRLGHDYIGPEHLLLGLIREGEGKAIKILVQLGVDLNKLRKSIENAIKGTTAITNSGTVTKNSTGNITSTGAFNATGNVNLAANITEATGTVGQITDGLGRRVATATVPALDPILPLTDQTYRVIWSAGAGLYSETSRTSTWTATEACLYFLRRSGVRIDRPRWRDLADDLDGFILAGATEKAVQPWTYLLDAVLPLLPISLILGPDGWRPVLFRHSWPAAHARAHLQVRPGELYEATQRETTGQLTPTIRLSWAYDADADAFRETMSCVGDPAERGTGVQTSAYTLAAYSRWMTTQASNTNALQEPPAYTWEADNIYDRATAARVVSWWTLARARPATILTYPASPNLLDLDLGDPVLLTDSTQGLSRAPALVEGLPLARRSSPTIRLRLLPSPLLPSYL